MGADPALPGMGRLGKIADYRLDGYVGQGSMAVVYLAQDERRHRQVALKVLAPELTRDDAFRTRMIRDSRAAAAMSHRHIVPVFDAGEEGGTLYVAMRHVSGTDLRSMLNRLGPLPPRRAWHIIAQIASALDAAHEHGLIHRDVKPANILVEADRGASLRPGGHAYLSDFGMSRTFSSDQIIATGQFTGPLDYAAPELIEGRDVDARADLYSLACTGFELLCGTPPFGQDQGLTLMYAQLYAPPPTATERRAGLPAAVDQVLARALAKNPADRYPSCGQFAEDLRAAVGLLRALPRPRSSPRTPTLPSATPALPTATATPTLPSAVSTLPAAPVIPAPPVDNQQYASYDRYDLGDQDDPDLQPSARRPGILKSIMAAGVVVVVVAAIAAGVTLTKRSSHASSAASAPTAAPPAAHSPPSSASPAAPVLASEQATALSTLLASSSAARTALHNAVRQVGSCTNVSGAVSQLQNVVNQRTAQYNQASALSTSALPNGAGVKSELTAALSISLTADQDYLTWARQEQQGGCTPSSQPSAYSAAYRASLAANVAKESFVQAWNPVAAKYGIKPISPRDM